VPDQQACEAKEGAWEIGARTTLRPSAKRTNRSRGSQQPRCPHAHHHGLVAAGSLAGADIGAGVLAAGALMVLGVLGVEGAVVGVVLSPQAARKVPTTEVTSRTFQFI